MNRYWQSKKYYNEEFMLAKWWHKLTKIELLKTNKNKYFWSVSGINIVTGQWHNEAFNKFPKLMIKVAN